MYLCEMDTIHKYIEISNERDILLKKIYSDFRISIKKLPILFNNFRWVSKPVQGYSSFYLYGKFIIIKFNEEGYFELCVYKDKFINVFGSLIYGGHHNSIEKLKENFINGLKKHIPEAYNDYKRKQILNKLI